MTISIAQIATAIAPNCQTSFQGVGGVEPYLYFIKSGGAGGSIDESTGIYTAPISFKSDPNHNYDTVIVIDSEGITAESKILVASPLILFCDIIRNFMCIRDDHIYLWDQKIMQPVDFEPYIAISVASAKPFGNSYNFNGTSNESDQFVSMFATLDIDIISRGPAARDRKEEIILALKSQYSQQQQSANSFKIATIPTRFINLSEVDGAAIPYRFRISVNMQYFYQKQTSAQYFDTFEQTTVATNP